MPNHRSVEQADQDRDDAFASDLRAVGDGAQNNIQHGLAFRLVSAKAGPLPAWRRQLTGGDKPPDSIRHAAAPPLQPASETSSTFVKFSDSPDDVPLRLSTMTFSNV